MAPIINGSFPTHLLSAGVNATRVFGNQGVSGGVSIDWDLCLRFGLVILWILICSSLRRQNWLETLCSIVRQVVAPVPTWYDLMKTVVGDILKMLWPTVRRYICNLYQRIRNLQDDREDIALEDENLENIPLIWPSA